MTSIEDTQFKMPESAMRELADLERLAREGVAAKPPSNFIAEFVQLQRAMLGWKQDALASFAGVSLSTVQRIERGEPVSAASLDSVAVALGQWQGAFSEPRVPLRGDQLKQQISKSISIFKDRIWVSVQPLRTQPQIAALARTHVYLVDGGRLGDAYDDDVAAFQENLDFLAYVLETEEEKSSRRKEPLKRRELYIAVLDQVRKIEQRAGAVALAGTYKAETNAQIMPTADVALIGFFPKSSDPGAIKRRALLAPAKIDLVDAWSRFCRTDG